MSKHWLLSNFITILTGISAIQNVFMGNFFLGVSMLITFLAYDIWFITSTLEVPLYMARHIDMPVKILFPTDWEVEEVFNWDVWPQRYNTKFDMCGLTDIMITGIFIGMLFRYDIMRSINVYKVEKLSESGNNDKVLEMLNRAAKTAPRPYFYCGWIGFGIAVISRVFIIISEDHGKPFNLYAITA